MKSDYSKAKRQQLTLKDLSWDSWNATVEPVLNQEWQLRTGYSAEVAIDCIGIIAVSDEPSAIMRPSA